MSSHSNGPPSRPSSPFPSSSFSPAPPQTFLSSASIPPLTPSTSSVTPSAPAPTLRSPSPRPSAPLLSSARRTHLLAKAQLLHQQREALQQQQIARLAALQSPSTPSHLPLIPSTHPLDPVISVNDSLHTRYTLQSLALSRALAHQQDVMAEMEVLVVRLQEAISPSNAPVVMQGSVEAENGVLREWVRALKGRVEERDAEVEVMRVMMQRKSARIGEVREESAVMMEEMKALLSQLTRERERREKEMREEREALLTGLREMIDVAVRENEWMKLHLTEDQTREMELWKDGELAMRDQRDEERMAIRQKEMDRQREKDTAQSQLLEAAAIAEQHQAQRVEEERQREADLRRKEAERSQYQEEERKLPEVSVPPVRSSVVLPSHPTSHLSVAAAPTPSSKRVHFRHPSASPTIYYSPAPSASPTSPFALPGTTVELQALPPVDSHLLPSSAAAQQLMLDGLQQQQRVQGYQHSSHIYAAPPPQPPSLPFRFEPPLNPTVNGYPPFTFKPAPPLPHSSPSSPTPLVSTASTSSTSTSAPSSPSLSSYFDGATDDFLQHTSPPPAFMLPAEATAHVEPVQGMEGWHEGVEDRREVNDGRDMKGVSEVSLHERANGVSAVTSSKVATPSSVSLSDQVMGRIGGWMLGNRGRGQTPLRPHPNMQT